MAKFYIENSDELSIERHILVDLLKSCSCIYSYRIVDSPIKLNDLGYPIGTIPFIENCLGIHENPIELPEYLRTDEFLKRDYKFMNWREAPRKGVYFLKDVSNLKSFGKVVNAEYEVFDELWTYEKQNDLDSTLVLDKNSVYLVSSLFDIKSEYRIYVFQGEIDQICFYNGDCTVLPDISLIQKAVSLINYNEEWLRSYTIDVMVGSRGTALIEVHNFTSCGLYSTIWGSNLITAYMDGIEYLKNDNHKLV